MWLFDAFNVIQTNTSIFISESNLLTFYLLYPFLIPFRSFPSYFCLLSIIATFSLPSVCFSSLFNELFLPPPLPFSSRVPTFWWNLHGNACYVGYLSSSSCVAGGVFATKPLFSQSVASPFSRRQSQILFYSKTFLARTVPPFTRRLLLLIPSLSPSPTHPLLLWPLFALSFPSVSLLPPSTIFWSQFRTLHAPSGCPVWAYTVFLISFNFSHSSTKKTSFLVRISVFNKFFMGTPHSSRPTEWLWQKSSPSPRGEEGGDSAIFFTSG